MTRKKFNPEHHKQVLTTLLIDIAKLLGGKIVFKGGTAAMLFYNLPRLSLDLDFDLLDDLSEIEIKKLHAIIEEHGAIKELRQKRFTLFFLLDYEPDTPNIKLEFNRRVWKNNTYKRESILGVPLKVADEPTMLSNKLVALTERKTAATRDLFDVYFFLKIGWQPKEALIKERTQKKLHDYLNFVTEYIRNNYSSADILQGIGELLDQSQKNWAKDHLIEEAIAQLERLKKNV